MNYIKVSGALVSLIVSLSSYGQAVTGTSMSVSGTSGGSNAMQQSSGGSTSNIVQISSVNQIYTYTQSGGNYTNNTFITTEPSKAQVGSSAEVSLFSGTINPVNGNISGTSSVTLTPIRATMSAKGDTAYSAVAWGPSSAATAADYTNYFSADATGSNIASATAITMNAVTTTITSTTNNIVGTTNINTTGDANTAMGSSGAGSVTLTSGTNSLVVGNSGAAITGNSSISGTLLVNGVTTSNGISNTGTFSSTGNAVIASASASTVSIGNSSGNSTISMNSNRIQNIGAGIAGTDAVNLNQLNTVSNNVSSLSGQVNNLNNQLQQSQTQYRSGIAGVAAMNGIGALNGNQRVNFGIGVGGFAGQAGIAAGGNIRITDNATFKASVAQASNNTAVSGGLTIGF